MRAALVEIETGVVVNVIVLHDEWPEPPERHHRYEPPDGLRVVLLHDESQVSYGWRHWRGLFIRPWERHPRVDFDVYVLRPRQRRAVSVSLIFRPHTIGASMSQGTLRIGQQLVCSLAIADAQGNAVVPPSPPAWSMATDGIAGMVVAADGLSATLTGMAVGQTDVNVVVEGDATPGVDTLHGTGTLQVLAGEASTVALDFGAPSSAPPKAATA